MAVIRVNKTTDYTVLSNYHLKEKEMTLKAKGLLSLMLSLPDNWDYSIAGLATLSKDGKESVMNALNEIEQFGYLRRTKTFDEKRRFTGYDYDIYEKPQREKPNEETPYSAFPNTDNPPQLNTKKSITNISNTNIYKDVIEHLNSKAGTKYRASAQATQRHIKARIAEGFTLDDFKTVIDKKCAEWLSSDMAKYLRPETLFGSKFESYLNAPVGNSKPNGSNDNLYRNKVLNEEEKEEAMKMNERTFARLFNVKR